MTERSRSPPPTLSIYRATTLGGTVWRAVPVLPPRAEHFSSYAELGRALPGALYLRLSSVSMYLSREHLHRARAAHGLPLEDVELDLRRDRNITYAVTNAATGHIEVWAPPEVLLACLVDG